METVALISGLVGALLSAILSFWVRSVLAARAQRTAEQRVAYVHFVRISELAAIDVIVVSLVKVMFNDKAVESLRGPGGSFEPSHRLSVLLADEVRKITPEKLKETPGISTVPKLLKGLLDNAKESQLSVDQLSKLPKETVLAYSLYLNYLTHIRQLVQLWLDFFETGDHSWVTPESVHDHWLAIATYFEHARKLRASLINSGAASRAEASALLSKQVETYNATLFSKWTHQPKIQAALAASKEASTKGADI